MRMIFLLKTLDALQIATRDFSDADRHGACDMKDGVEMVGHEAELKDADLGVIGVDMQQFIDDGIAEVGALNGGLRRIIVGDEERAEEWFAVGCD